MLPHSLVLVPLNSNTKYTTHASHKYVSRRPTCTVRFQTATTSLLFLLSHNHAYRLKLALYTLKHELIHTHCSSVTNLHTHMNTANTL
jgi:hypothetical protein